MKPARLLDQRVCTPPTKPTWQVLVFSAAAAPTRKEPCSSSEHQRARSGHPWRTGPSIRANLTFGCDEDADRLLAGSSEADAGMTGL